jgi:hypothetical protein
MLAALVLGTAPTASARTIPLGWVERHSAYGRHFVMTFTVTSVTIDRHGWSARVSLRNDTNLYVRVANRFALVGETTLRERVILNATKFEPRLPTMLGFIQRWVGTIRGNGTPPKGSRLRLRFAEFRVNIAPNLVIRHVTRHWFRW